MAANKSTSDNIWITVLSTLLAISIALNIIVIFKGSSIFPAKKEMAAANAELSIQMQKYKSEINQYAGISSKIDQIVASANINLEAKEKQIASLKREKRSKEKENRNLMMQLDSLQDRYIGMIDSVLVEREKRKIINQRIGILEDQITVLNTRIGLGSILFGDNLVVSPMKTMRNGKKEVSAMAKKTTEFDVCIDIIENKLSKSGSRNIYFVITSPNAEVIYDGSAEAPEFYNPEFKTNALCSKIDKINYQNKKLNVCSVIKPKTPLAIGLYVMEVFSDEQKLAMTTFTLR